MQRMQKDMFPRYHINFEPAYALMRGSSKENTNAIRDCAVRHEDPTLKWVPENVFVSPMIITK